MTDVFLYVLNLSFSAIWVVLGILAARLLLKRASRSLICGLWGLVALRLIFGGIITAPFSLIPSDQLITPESLYDQSPTIHSGISSIDNVINPIYSEALRPFPGASVNPLQIWLAVFANLWILGMIAMTLWAAVSCLRLRRQVRESIRIADGIYVCDRLGSAFLFGLFRPRIYLPSQLNDTDRTHVIAHERTHLRRRDHWWKPLGFALLTVNWFNPVLWLAYWFLCRDIELACDECVVKNLSPEEKKAYSEALLRCSMNHRQISACPLAFGEVGVKQRIRSVLHYKKPAFWALLLGLILTAVLAAGLLTNPRDLTSEIRCNGFLYVLEHKDVSYLPVEKDRVGDLVSILHNTAEHPALDFQGTNLDESLAGCPLYLEEDRLYLQKYDGTCMMFRLSTDQPYEDRSFTWDDITLHVTIPDGWETEEIEGNGYFGFRFRSSALTNGWITVKYWPDLVVEYKWAGTVTETQFPSGLTGKVYRTGDSDPWTRVCFYSDTAYMSVELPEDYLWPTEYFDQTLDVIGTIRAYRGTEPLFLSEPDEPSLGITLRVENVSPWGATLVCTQDGTLWTDIITGSDYDLQQFRDGEWVSRMPESTFWTSIAYLVNQGQSSSWDLGWNQLVGKLEPGHYRIGKIFTGSRRPPYTLNLPTEETTQTLYAEFVIE